MSSNQDQTPQDDPLAAIRQELEDLKALQKQNHTGMAQAVGTRLKDLSERLSALETAAQIATQQQAPANNNQSRAFHDINDQFGYDFEIKGANTPFVQMVLKPGREIVAEPGTFMFKTEGVEMSMALGDGSEGSFLGKIWSVVKRKIGGEKALLTHFKNAATVPQTLSLAAGQTGEVIAINLADVGGAITCQRGAFMAAAGGTSISVGLPKRIRTGLFSGEGFILQKISGQGHVFINGGGDFATYTLGAGEKLQIDTGCVLAMTDDIAKRWNIEFDKSPMSMIFNERGLFLTTVEGPGQIWVQSMPFSRQVANMATALNGHFKKPMWRFNNN